MRSRLSALAESLAGHIFDQFAIFVAFTAQHEVACTLQLTQCLRDRVHIGGAHVLGHFSGADGLVTIFLNQIADRA